MDQTFTLNDILTNIENNTITNNGRVLNAINFPPSLNGDTVFDKITFTKAIYIQGCKSEKLIRFFNCTFEGAFNIFHHSNLREVHFANCTFQSAFTVQNTTIKQFTLKDNIYNQGIDAEDITGDSLCLDGVKSENAKFRFIKPEYNRIRLSEARDNSEFIFSSYDAKLNSFVKNSANTGFAYIADSQFKGLVLVAGLTIGALTLNGHNNTGRIMFQQLTVGLISIGQFTNTGLLSFSNITPDPFSGIIQCHRSNLGKCEIYDVNFALFKSIVIDNTNVQDIITTNITWCRSVGSDMMGIHKQAHLRENYRQLKNVMIRQNDKVQELAYHRLEMDALLLAQRIEGGNRADRFIIWTNKVSNAHGLSWLRAFSILFTSTLISYITVNLLMGRTHYDATRISYHTALFFESINPVRKFSAIYGDTTGNLKSDFALLIDVLYRLLSSYLIFQFISAFRKYVKK